MEFPMLIKEWQEDREHGLIEERSKAKCMEKAWVVSGNEGVMPDSSLEAMKKQDIKELKVVRGKFQNWSFEKRMTLVVMLNIIETDECTELGS